MDEQPDPGANDVAPDHDAGKVYTDPGDVPQHDLATQAEEPDVRADTGAADIDRNVGTCPACGRPLGDVPDEIAKDAD
jgi:hypothetical protein